MATNQQEVVNCECDPNFAVITSYILKFGPLLSVSCSISDLKQMLEDTEKISEELVDLHIKLLRKRRKYINKEKWEKALVKFIAEYSNVEAWELERCGYKHVKLSLRLEAIKRLLEAQFDCNTKFKSEVNALDASSLRLLPVGKDVNGNQYWYQLDEDLNLRIYKEEPEEENSWAMVCNDRDSLYKLITDLNAKKVNTIKEESSATVSENDDSNLAKEEDSKETSEKKLDFENLKQEPKSPIVCEPDLSGVVEDSFSVKCNGSLEPGEISAVLSNDVVKRRVESPGKEISPSETEDLSSMLSIAVVTETTSRDSCELETLHQPLEFCFEDVVHCINGLLSAVEGALAFKDSEDSEQEIDSVVRDVCASLVSTICGELDGEPACTEELESADASLGRGRGRPRGRAPTARGRKKGRGRGMSICLAVEESGPTPVKRSQRIQALQEKRNAALAEQMKQEQLRLEKLAKERSEKELKKQDLGGSQKSKKQAKSESEYSQSENENESESEEERKKRKKRKKRKHGKFPWDTESSSSESSEESEIEEEEEEEVLKFDDHEDEFACEDIEPDAEPVILKRARTVKKVRSDTESSESEENDDTPCRRCEKYDHPEWILLCDKCDEGYHTACLKPPLMMIPDGDWFCPPCENKSLLELLQVEYENLGKLLEKRDREKLRKERLQFAAISVNNILKQPKGERKSSTESQTEKAKVEVKREDEEGGGVSPASDDGEENENGYAGSDGFDEEDDDYFKLRSVRAGKRINYQFKEYDELINSAIREEEFEEDGYVYTKEEEVAQNQVEVIIEEPKPIVQSEDVKEAVDNVVEEPLVAKAESEDDIHQESAETNLALSRTSRMRSARKRRLNDLDSPTEDDDSDESFKGASDTEVEDLTEEEEEEDSAADSITDESDDSAWKSSRKAKTRSTKSTKKSPGKRGGKGYRRDGFVVDSDDSEAGYGGSAKVRTRLRNKRVSYKEISSDETEEEQTWCWKSSKSTKRKSREDSSEEWESDESGKKKGKWSNKKARDEEEEEEDEEEEEEEEDDDEEEEEEEEEDDGEASEESLPAKAKTKKVEMRGKPRLSKARVMNLNEDSDEEEAKGTPGDENNSPGESEEYDKTDNQELVSEPPDERTPPPPPPAPPANVPLSLKAQLNAPLVQPSVSPNLTPSAPPLPPPPPPPQPLLPTAVVNASSTLSMPANMPLNATVAVSSVIVSNSPVSSVQVPIASTSQRCEPSALSQLTAFAARGPITSVPSSLSQSPQTTYNNFSPNQPPPLVHSSIERDDGDSYSITSLDSFSGRQKPLKPSLTTDSYPQTSSPSRLLNLDPNYRQTGSPSRLVDLNRFHNPSSPSQFNNFDKRAANSMATIEHRVPPTHSPYAPPPPRDFNGRPQFAHHGPDYPPQAHPRNFYEARFNRGPPMPQNVHQARPAQPGVPYRHGPIHHPSSPNVGYFPSAHQQPRFYPPPPPVPQNPERCGTLPSSNNYPSHFPPQGMPPNPYGYYGPTTGLTANGGFMIQNLLQQRANANNPNPSRTDGPGGPVNRGAENLATGLPVTSGVSLTANMGPRGPPPENSNEPGAVGNPSPVEDELKSVADIVSYITQE